MAVTFGSLIGAGDETVDDYISQINRLVMEACGIIRREASAELAAKLLPVLEGREWHKSAEHSGVYEYTDALHTELGYEETCDECGNLVDECECDDEESDDDDESEQVAG